MDETGARIKGVLHWFHVTATKWLTLYGWHRKRGQETMNEIGVLPNYTGRLIHDRWSSYDGYLCAHSVCGAHLLRDCLLLAEHDQQSWAQAMHDLLLRLSQTAEQWRARGAKVVPKTERDGLVLQYFELLQQGFAANSQLSTSRPKKSGRPKQSDAKNLLDALFKRAEQVLAFLDDLLVPFTNNQVEHDLRMMKVQQKISAPFAVRRGRQPFVPFAVSFDDAQTRSLHACLHGRCL